MWPCLRGVSLTTKMETLHEAGRGRVCVGSGTPVEGWKEQGLAAVQGQGRSLQEAQEQALRPRGGHRAPPPLDRPRVP